MKKHFLLITLLLLGCHSNSKIDPIPTPTMSGYQETTVEYHRVERIINGYTVPAHLLEVKLKSLSDLRSCIAVDEEGNYGVDKFDSLQNIAKQAKERDGLSILGAINGDYTFASERRRGYSVKNGIIYRTAVKSSSSVDLVFKTDNTVSLMKEGDFKLDGEVGERSQKYWQVISFGPLLANDSKMIIEEDEELPGNTWVNNQRSCIGIVSWNHFFFMATEANQRTSKTLQSFRLYDLGTMLLEYGCHSVYNLDGGYSSGLIYNDEVVFQPTRDNSDIIYIVNG